jgi:predicted transglutaminase-like cysteine proteinase
MKRTITILATIAAVVAMGFNQAAEAAFFGYPRVLKQQLAHVRFDTPALAPLAHTFFCMQYPQDCVVRKLTFRHGIVYTPFVRTKLELTEQRWNDLAAVTVAVNRAIRPEANTGGLLAERWLIAPVAGDCNDYAVTKRHRLIALGWPPQSLLLAEVVTAWGEHHLVVVASLDAGDFVIDSLNDAVRPWSRTGYKWVRVQTPSDPRLWATIARPRA